MVLILELSHSVATRLNLQHGHRARVWHHSMPTRTDPCCGTTSADALAVVRSYLFNPRLFLLVTGTTLVAGTTSAGTTPAAGTTIVAGTTSAGMSAAEQKAVVVASPPPIIVHHLLWSITYCSPPTTYIVHRLL